MAIELYPFQETASAFLQPKRRAYLGSDLGTGKTAVLIDAAEHYGSVTLKHVVCPASLQLNWIREIEMWTGKKAGCKGLDIQRESEWCVWSYEALVKHKDAIKAVKRHQGFIFDEAHYLKSRAKKEGSTTGSLRTAAAIGANGVARKAEFAWLAGATPFPNNIVDCYGPFNFCMRGKLGYFKNFAQRYAYIKKNDWGYEKPYGFQKDRLPELVDVTRKILWRDFLEDVAPELPPYTESWVPLKKEGHGHDLFYQAKLGKEGVANIIAKIENDIDLSPQEDDCLSSWLKIFGMQKVSPAVEFAMDILDQDEQLVIFTKHVDVANAIHKALEAATKIPVGLITGEISVAQRDQDLMLFQKGHSQCLVCTIEAGGVGLTMTAARIVVSVERVWSGGTFEQSVIGRVHRLGQKRPQQIYHLYYENSFDEVMTKILANKRQAASLFWQEFKTPGSIEVKSLFDAEIAEE